MNIFVAAKKLNEKKIYSIYFILVKLRAQLRILNVKVTFSFSKSLSDVQISETEFKHGIRFVGNAGEIVNTLFLVKIFNARV